MSAPGQPFIVDLAVKNVKMVVQPEVNTPESQMRGSENDPNSVGTLQRQMAKLNGQAIADRRYDPSVPSPEGFCSGRGDDQLSLTLIAAALMVSLALALRLRR